MDEQLKRESKKWESENTALKLEVATGKEHAKVSVYLLYPYYMFSTSYNIIFIIYYIICINTG